MASESSSYKVESGVQLLTRLKKIEIHNIYPKLLTPSNKKNIVVEISSTENTLVLINDIICECITTKTSNDVEIGVLFLNTNNHFNFQTLHCILRKKVYKKLCSVNRYGQQINFEQQLNSAIERALEKFYIMDIYDATQFYITIQNLDSILTNKSYIHLLIIDSLTAFYWSEQSFKIMKMDAYLKRILGTVQKVIKEHNVTFIYTKPEYFTSNKVPFEDLECTEEFTIEQVNQRISLSYDNLNNTYLVCVRTHDTVLTKTFKVKDNEIMWC